MKDQHQFISNGMVSQENIRFYKQYGYSIAPQLFSADEIAQLKRETIEIFKGKRGKLEGLQEVLPGDSDTEVLKKYLCIHFPHKISTVILDFVKHSKVASILQGFVSENVKAMQSMLFVKAPGKPGQSWHQDEYYIPTRDRSLIGVWIAVDDADIENGCLWIIPGSQTPGYFFKRVPYNGPEFGDADNCDISPYEDADAIPVEVKAGSVVFFNGYTLHCSLRNKTNNNFRTALVNHYMSAESLLPWDNDGRIPGVKDDNRDIVMVAGKDPYAYRPITPNLTQPFLRPDNFINLRPELMGE